MAHVVSINVGMPKDVAWAGRTVHTGIWKSPVAGPVMLRRLNLDGDGQGDLAGHGGEQRAVLAYQIESYRHWEQFLGRDRLEPGSFGENLTIDGLSDDDACIGDRYRIGEAELEVTQPRVTCFRVGLRMDEPRLPSLLVAHHRPGFYLRVITEGRIAAGDEIVRTRVGPHSLSVAEIDALLYLPDRDPARLQDAVEIPALSPGWRGSFEDLLAGAAGAPPLGDEPRPAAWAGFRTLQVTAVTAESTGIGSIYLDSADGQPLPPPRAGQFLALRIPGAGDPAPVRSYSLSGDPAAAGYRISVKREPHGLVSSYVHSHLRPGAQIEVAAPRGDFVLDAGTNPVALVSAGVGVTPVLAMLHQLATQRTARQVWWVHTTHDASTHAFAVEAGDLLGSLADVRSFVFYTAPSELPPPDSGISVGRLTAEVIASLQVPSEASAYVCGPEHFMDDVIAALQVAGLDPARLHTERFGARAPINPGVVGETPHAPHPPAGPRGSGPLVTFARSGLSTAWSDDFASVLELAEACDVPTQWSCRTGVCHTCMTAVLSGDTRYVTPPLEEPASGEVLICSAQPTTDLVIDL